MAVTSITFRNLMEWLRKSLAFLLIVTVLFGVGSFIVTKYLMEPIYRSSVKFYAGGEENSTQGFNYALSVAPQYIEFLNVTEFYEDVSKDILESTGQEVSPRKIAASLSFSSIIEETSSFFVTVSAEDPNLSYNIALSVAKTAPARIAGFEHIGSLQILSNPSLPTAPAGPDVTRNTLMGLLLGFVLSAAIVIARELLDNRIQSSEEISELFGLPIFGTVPDFSTGDKKGGR